MSAGGQHYTMPCFLKAQQQQSYYYPRLYYSEDFLKKKIIP
jgi:hypothetical protein